MKIFIFPFSIKQYFVPVFSCLIFNKTYFSLWLQREKKKKSKDPQSKKTKQFHGKFILRRKEMSEREKPRERELFES